MPFTKKELQSRFNLSKSAVHNRLNDCGLDTTKSEYTDEEIETRFLVACQMMSGGSSRKSVREYFQVKPSSSSSDNDSQSKVPKFGSHITFMDAIKDAAYGMVQTEIEAAVKALLPYTPLIVRQEWLKVIESGEFQQAFLDYHENYQVKAQNEYYQEDLISYDVSSSMPNGLAFGTDELDDDYDDEDEDDDEDDEFLGTISTNADQDSDGETDQEE
jgi:hypothetical protein